MIEITDYPFTQVRLGNRLFIYTYARLLAEELGLYLPSTNLTLFKGNDCDRFIMNEIPGIKYDTPHFNIEDNLAFTYDNISKVINLIKQYHNKSKIIISGYLPNFKYFKGYEHKIKQIYSNLIKPVSYNCDEIAITLRKSYVDKRFYLPPQYYLNVIEKIKPKKIYLFADDINRHSSLIQKLNYPYQIMSLTPVQQLTELTKFDTLILSQGTFCFFAGYLSNASKVYQPVTTTGPNSREEPLMDLIADDIKYINIPVDNKIFV